MGVFIPSRHKKPSLSRSQHIPRKFPFVSGGCAFFDFSRIFQDFSRNLSKRYLSRTVCTIIQAARRCYQTRYHNVRSTTNRNGTDVTSYHPRLTLRIAAHLVPFRPPRPGATRQGGAGQGRIRGQDSIAGSEKKTPLQGPCGKSLFFSGGTPLPFLPLLLPCFLWI